LRRYIDEPPLLTALAANYSLPKERIFLEEAIIGIIHRVFDNTLNPDSEVLLPELSYPYYFKVAKNNGTKIRTFSFNGDNTYYDIDDLVSKLQSKPKIAVIVDPESPMGFSTKNDDLEKVLSSSSPETLIVLDQAHEGFREKNVKDVSSLVRKFPNLLIARDFSKFYGLAGLRVGYALCGEKVKSLIDFNEHYLGFSSIAQSLAIASLNSEEHYKANAAMIREEKKRFNHIISKLPGYKAIETDSEASIVVVPEQQRGIFEQQTEKAKVLFRHLGQYHDRLNGHYKITMCPSEQMDRIINLFESVSWLHQSFLNEKSSSIETRKEGYSVNLTKIHYDNSGILMGINRVIIPPQHAISGHLHETQDEIFEFFSDGSMKIDNKNYNFKPGDMLTVKAGTSHEIHAPEERFGRFISHRFPYEPRRF
jgi:histidinol-phosphate aminotransferase